MPVPNFSTASTSGDVFTMIRRYVANHDGPIAKSDVLALLAATLKAAASKANTRDTFTALGLSSEAAKMR